MNVGMLFYFPEQRRLEFRFPESLRRLRLLYRNFPERQIRTYLQSIGERVARANNELSSELTINEYEAFIEQELLRYDATVLRFGSISKVVPHSSNEQIVAQHYYSLYFTDNPALPAHERIKDEDFILRQFRISLKKQDAGVAKLLQKDVKVSVPETTVNFDYAWQNGTLNLVKPISFDLKNDREIHRKALLYYGNFNLLAEVAKKHKYRFDILVAGPTNPKLNKEYLRAVNILRETTAPKRLVVEDEDLNEYSKSAAENLRDHYQPNDIGLFLPPAFN